MFSKVHQKLQEIFTKKVVFRLVLLVVLFLMLGYILDWSYTYYRRHDAELTIGFVTDIHAGNHESKEKGSGFIFPTHFEKNFSTALDDMKYDDYVVALGDNIDDGGKNCETFANQLKNIARGDNMLWVKGNHDKDACFPFLSPKNYYFVDVKDWRIIIINNSYWYPDEERPLHRDKIGDIDEEQMQFVQNALKTDKKVLIGMHLPLWNDNGDNNFSIRDDYVDFKKMIEESGNVKYVLSGHYHNDNWEHEENGITYYIIPSIEQEGYEGFYMSLDLTKQIKL